jgi:hypothetical protein
MMKKPCKCKVCGAEFTKTRPLQNWCSIECAVTLGQQALAKKKAKEQAQDRKETRQKLDAMQTKPELVKKAQTAFNAFIRARDAGKPCISCGKPSSNEANGWDSGHFRSVGSAPHMRFVEDNCAKQCKKCNQFLSGNHVAMRVGLIERIGLARVEQIEADNTVRKYTHEGLREIAKQYRAMTQAIKNLDM